jgi:hypothetical protein
MFGKFCLRVAVGIAVFLVFGGKDALGVLVMTVVCTAGVGLLIVIPAAYLLGLVLTIWFIPFGRRKDKEGPEENSGKTGQARPSHVNTALRDYIRAAGDRDQDWESIRRELLKSGWDEQAVDLAGRHAGIVNPLKP